MPNMQNEQETDEGVVEEFVKPLVLGMWFVDLLQLPGLLVIVGIFAVMIFGDGA